MDKTQTAQPAQSTIDGLNTMSQHHQTALAAISSIAPPQPHVPVPQHRQVPLIAPAQPRVNRLMVPANPQMQMQQMRLIAPMQHQSHVYTASLTSNAIFRGRKKRSGKWSNEEEAYADLLIELFEKGLIDEQNGCTLRSCLSRRLHCLPMRISKKYAGKGIGKAVYLSKNVNAGFDSAVVQRNMTRLREAEMTFMSVVYPELNLVRRARPVWRDRELYGTYCIHFVCFYKFKIENYAGTHFFPGTFTFSHFLPQLDVYFTAANTLLTISFDIFRLNFLHWFRRLCFLLSLSHNPMDPTCTYTHKLAVLPLL
jgi:hypothetical protein